LREFFVRTRVAAIRASPSTIEELESIASGQSLSAARFNSCQSFSESFTDTAIVLLLIPFPIVIAATCSAKGCSIRILKFFSDTRHVDA
jgi:hypothetical protein